MSRVLMVNDIAEVGGGKTAMLDIARVLLDDGFDVHLACPDGPLAVDGAALGATFHPFAFEQRRMLGERSHLPRPAAAAARRREHDRLAALADEIGADIVHTGATVPHLDAVAGRRSTKVLWHVNQVHPAYLFAGPLPDRIVSVSAAALAPGRWRRGVRSRGSVIPNGIDLDRFHPPAGAERKAARLDLQLRDDDFAIVTVARLEPAKGVGDLIEATAATDCRPVLVVVGDSAGYSGGDSHEGELRKRAAQLGIDVRFLGARADIDRILHAADLFAFASHWEAFGLALAEASASGLPIVTTDAGGCAEVVEDGVTGVLHQVGAVDAFAASFDALAADPGRRRQLGDAGRARVRANFDLAALGPRLVPVYRQLVSA